MNIILKMLIGVIKFEIKITKELEIG